MDSKAFQKAILDGLRTKLSQIGESPEYDHSWKTWVTPNGLAIPATRAAARKSATDQATMFGFPTPRVQDSKSADQPTSRRGVVSPPHLCAAAKEWFDPNDQSQLVGWPTPMAGAEKTEENNAAGNSDYSRAVEETAPLVGWGTPRVTNNGNLGSEERAEDAKSRLEDQCFLAAPISGWNSPTAGDSKDRDYQYPGGDRTAEPYLCLPGQAKLCDQAISGWQTPTVVDSTGRDYVYPSGDHSKPFLTLPGQAMLCDQEVIPTGWVTPASRDYKDGEGSEEYQERRADRPKGNPLGLEVRGAIPESSTAATGRTGALVLRPGFSLWLMLGRDAQKWLNSSPFFSSAEQIRSWLSDFYASRPATEPES